MDLFSGVRCPNSAHPLAVAARDAKKIGEEPNGQRWGHLTVPGGLDLRARRVGCSFGGYERVVVEVRRARSLCGPRHERIA